MTRFRPCIDLHAGQVKQIVGGTLTTSSHDLKTNYISTLSANYYAELYKANDLRGGHVIMLGPGNDEAALEALRSWPSGLQVGGGITDQNALKWIEAGADKVHSLYIQPCANIGHRRVRSHLHLGTTDDGVLQVIVTSYLFPSARFSLQRLEKVLSALDNDKSKLVLDLSCRKKDGAWFVAMNKWQTLTDMEISKGVHNLAHPIILSLN